MISNQSKDTKGTSRIFPNSNFQDLLPGWLTLSLNKVLGGRNITSQVCFGHYMIFHEQKSDGFSKLSPSPLFAFDLRDNSIQEASLNRSVLSEMDFFTFTKYQDNQIIKLAEKRGTNAYGTLERITIESFKRTFCSLLEISPLL